ncbi:putative membrane protein (TIGR04086 family) [Anoxybacillus voinovskiensis]|uniref:Putative membrane protein (TIGR04086 family) n=1 Tax=Anoxybacteroides voinovskiense TaxID=230470 RepID=A0A840DJM0_9BACL|nr:TIGR04086 family membrane protein [Anoxybacillus voinovskiensis]MBB4073264.1 putative membrane protein (TIGR04086 family) [Anoxybacillus voinovskiensis]GGJ67139.1 putative membrane protein YrzE [Anoxybacillus voinovskiensis]
MARFGKAVAYGVVTIFLLASIVSMLLSLLLKWTDVQESSLTFVIFACSLLSVFIGGVVAGGKGKERGWLIGGATGVCFTFIIFLFQFLGMEKTFSAQQWLYHLGFLAVAMIGGIMGVNFSSSRQH